NLRRLLAGSAIIASHHESPHLVQDAYSLRCAPQVHGAFRDILGYARGVLEVEMGSVSDNPLVLPEDDAVVSGGNFHGQPVAVEVLAAAQAQELRSAMTSAAPAPATAAALAAMRDVVPHLAADRELKPDVDAAIELVECGELLEAVEAVTGPLD